MKKKKQKQDNLKSRFFITKKSLYNGMAAILLLLLSVLFCMGGAEIFARLYDRYSNFPIHPRTEMRDDSPNTSRIAGTEILKPQGVKRILVLGDSIAFGQAIMKKETFPERLENLLNSEKDPPEYEVINTGFMGIDTVQELYVLINRGPFGSQRPELVSGGFVGLAYNPDIIILTYAVTTDALLIDQNLPFEVAMPHRWESDRSRKWSYGDYAIPVNKPIDNWLGKHSYFYHYFLSKYDGLLSMLGLRDHTEKIRNMFKPNSPGWIRSRSALYRISEIARKKKIPVVLVIWGTDNDTPLKDIYSIVAEEGKKAGYHVLNFVEDIVWPKENFRVSMTDQHDNPKAHKIAADAIHHFLKEKNLVVR